MTADQHSTETEAQAIPEHLVELLRQRMGQIVVVQHRHWADEGFALSGGTFQVMEVDVFWPSILLQSRPGVATRVPLRYVLSVSTPDGVVLFNAAS